MFAAKAGAKLVYAVDACPNVCQIAQELIKYNHLQEKIQVINKRIEHIDKFDENIDMIISEWMGKISPAELILHQKIFSFRFLSLS